MDRREVELEGVDWMRLDQYTDKWRVPVNTLMIIRDPFKVGIFITRLVTTWDSFSSWKFNSMFLGVQPFCKCGRCKNLKKNINQ
jgi:hypothetical protein